MGYLGSVTVQLVAGGAMIHTPEEEIQPDTKSVLSLLGTLKQIPCNKYNNECVATCIYIYSVQSHYYCCPVFILLSVTPMREGHISLQSFSLTSNLVFPHPTCSSSRMSSLTSSRASMQHVCDHLSACEARAGGLTSLAMPVEVLAAWKGMSCMVSL